MTERVDDKALPNDKFGFRIYGVMAHLPEPQASQARQFHKLIGADDLATKPHCSIDNFWGPDDLEAVKSALEVVASNNKPFETSVDLDDLQHGCVYGLVPTEEHLALYADVQKAMLPLTKRIWPAGTDYWPHTTMVLDPKPEEMPLLDANLAKVDMTGTMQFDTISLIGRVGLARGGEYHVLADFPLLG